MWIGDAVYFNSDRTGVFNLYRYDVATRQTRQLTHYKDWDVRWPSADAEGQIVYELDGELHIYDMRNDQDRALSILVPADATTSRPQSANAADNIESLAIESGRRAGGHRGARRCVLGSRGTRRHPQSHAFIIRPRAGSGVVDRRQASGLCIRSQRRGRTLYPDAGRQRSCGAADLRFDGPLLRAAVVGRRQAHRHCRQDRTSVRDRSGGQEAHPHRARSCRDDSGLSLVARRPIPELFAQRPQRFFLGVYIWSVADGKSRRVTPQYFNAQSAAWAPGGDIAVFFECARISAVDQHASNSISRPTGRPAYSR